MKNNLRKKKTSHALLASLAASLGAYSAGSHAVNLSTDGTGQVLIYPYYTVRNGFVTSFTVQNTDTRHSKALKVHFREGKAGAPVLSFHVMLPPRDIWSASIVEKNGGAAVFTTDKSCTTPQVSTTQASAVGFVNYFYTGQVTGTFADNAGAGLDRTREGYVEIIEMGVIANGADAASSPATNAGTNAANAIKPTGADGTPSSCASVNVNDLFVNGVDILKPAGGLSGSYIIINGATGTEFAHKAIALDNFFVPATGNGSLYTNPGLLTPDLASVSPARSVVLSRSSGGGDVFTVTDWVAEGGRPIDAVSAVLMHAAISGEYDASSTFKTDFVVTMPTKPYYVASANGGAATTSPVAAPGPFTGTFASVTNGAASSCDRTVGRTYDRQGNGIATTWEPGQTGPDLCWTSTVLTVTGQVQTQAAASVFASANSVLVRTDLSAGSLSIWPTRADGSSITSGPGQSVSSPAIGTAPTVTNETTAGLRNLAPGGNRYRGLPIVGFAAIQAITGGQGYGGIFGFKNDPSVGP